MSDTLWTKEQKKAITIRGCSLLVAAAAGSGKTAVLVERIIQKVIDENNPVDIDKLLIVTFTNAAASEMRERIGDALSRELDKKPDSKRLQKQVTLLNKSNISTIHSFCLDVIRNNFNIIDIDTNFRIGDETEGILLKQQCLEELMEEKYSEGEENFIRLADSYSGKDDYKLQDMILSLYKFAMSSPWPIEWLDNCAEKLNIDDKYDFGSTIYAKELTKSIKIEVSGLENSLEDALSSLKDCEELSIFYKDTFVRDIALLNAVLQAKEWNELEKEFANFDFEVFPRKKIKEEMKAQKDEIKAIRDYAKTKMYKIRDDIFSVSDTTGLNIKKMYPVIKALSETVKQFIFKYSKVKKERGIMDFNDIEHFCLDILVDKNEDGTTGPSKAANQYIEKFEEVLIDEYQDSNLVQEEILKSISKKDDDGIPYNIFMVGDVKQSIYRFRQARPELFLSKYNNFSEVDSNSPQRKIKLFKNFRSREEVINGVNYVFKQIMTKNIGELQYDDSESLNKGNDFPVEDCNCGGPVELHIIEKLKNDDYERDESTINEENSDSDSVFDDSNEDMIDNVQLEAKIVAHRISELFCDNDGKKFKVYDGKKNKYRDIEYKDIVILMRATANYSPVFMDELMKAKIPVYSDTSTGYFETTEIKIMLSLLKIVDNPLQDIALLAVLRSPIASFTPEELMDIRITNIELPFYEAMKKCSENDNDLGRKVLYFLNRLNTYREKVIHMEIDDFIWYVYTDTGYYGYCGALVGGDQRIANLRLLFEKARDFEKTSFKGLFNFINFIDKLKNSSGDMGSAKILGESENVVRIMSIHKSKGLEFPVVFLCGTGKGFNLMDLNKNILYHHDMGFGPDYIDLEKRISYSTIVKAAIKKKIMIETLSEEMRILYVAFTRAKEKLIITGAVKNMEKSINKWNTSVKSKEQKLPEYIVLYGRNYLDWICPSLMRHKDGKILRDLIDSNIFCDKSDESKWSIRIWDKDKLINENIEEEKENFDIVKKLEFLSGNTEKSDYSEKVKTILNYNYKYKEETRIPAKLTVSEIKRMIQKRTIDEESERIIKDGELKKPLFLQEKAGFSAAEKGTLTHLVMQHINLDYVKSKENIINEVNRLKEGEFITSEQAKVIDINKIYKFFQSDIGKRMLLSSKVYREVPFYIEISASEFYDKLSSNVYSGDKLLMQGIIDCYFEEENRIVVLDYKTDYFENIQEISDKYSMQLNYYKRAIEEITGQTVKEKYIYLFKDGTILEL